MVGFETDLSLFQDVDEVAMILGGNVALEPPLDGGHEAGEFGPVLVPIPGAVDGGGEFVQESLQIVFHVPTLSASASASALRRFLEATRATACAGTSPPSQETTRPGTGWER